MGAPYAGGSLPEGQGSYFTDPQPTSAHPYLPSQNRDPPTPMNLPGAFPVTTPDARPFQNTTPRGSSDREWQQRQSYQNPNSQDTERYNQENGPLLNMRPGADANNEVQAGSRRPSGPRICAKCQLPLSGQFVRALDNTYHLECFTCQECGKIVASKFFPVPDEGPNQYPLCETDYFRRLDLLCHSCGGALRGSYITALDRKYHIEHFTCSVCPTVFGAQDSYYEHEGNVYCHYHYSTKFAQRCQGCQNAILKQFVEIFRNGQNQHWHPECYMIHKYWNVRLSNVDKEMAAPAPIEPVMTEEDASDEIRRAVRADEEKVEEKVLWIWRTLSAFEEKSAQCISEMLVNVSSGKYIEGIQAARKFIVHVELFFASADDLDQMLTAATPKGLSYGREAKLLCKKIVNFFQLLSASVDAGMQRLGVTQELLSLVTGLAHYLKLLIRICLQGALRFERETGSAEGLRLFLDRINTLEEKLDQTDSRDATSEWRQYVHRTADSCPVCDKPVEDKCAKRGNNVFHLTCLTCKNCGVELGDNLLDARWSPSKNQVYCSRCSSLVPDSEGGFKAVTRLQQYIVLLKVSHARLLATLQSSGAVPHTTDDPNLAMYDSSRGHRGGDDLALLRSQTRSQSYAGSSAAGKRESSYEQALGDIRRLRSTRLDKNLSNSMRRARSSRIIEGPGGLSVEPGADDLGTASKNRQSMLKIEHDRDQNGGDGHLTLDMSSMALDDIPRLVAQEQAKDQRPNASKYARGNLVGEEPRAKLVNGHRRDFSGDPDNMPIMSEEQMQPRTKYFSELSALEYFIVRHLAVLSMEPLLDGHFNQQELLELIETKRSTFWDKFKFKPDKSAGKKGKGIFGKTLEVVCERDGADSTDGIGPGTLRVPAVVDNAVSAMRNMDMSVEGVFRKNGNIRRLKYLSEEIDAKGSEAVDLTKETPVQVAALLKKFLRELPDPVLSYKLHRLFILAAKIQEEDKRRRVLHLTCCLLPKVHRDTMEVLFAFLNWAASFHAVDEESGSKMDVHNLATVIAPNILYSNHKNPDMDASFLAIEAVHELIKCNESMCEVPDDLLSLLEDRALFETNADITTKEILKRWGEIGRVPQATMATPGLRTPRSREGWNAVTQVTPDPQAWQNESSVRHIGSGNMTYGPSSNVNTPPSQYQYPSQNDVQGSPNRHSQFRSSAMQKPGALGITGAG